MARDGSGNYSFITSSWNPAVTLIEANKTDWNALLTDVKNGLTQSVSSDGQTIMTNNFNMGGFKVSNAANAVGSTDLVALGQMNTAITAGITVKVSKSGDTMTGGLNLARASIVQNATTMDLFALSNTIVVAF